MVFIGKGRIFQMTALERGSIPERGREEE